MPLAELLERKSAYESAMDSFDRAADALELPAEVRVMMRHPERVLQICVPVRMDDGRIEDFDGCGVQHNTSRGPAYGGVRLRPRINLDDVRALAMALTWKYAVMNIPFGGGKGGIAVDSQKLSAGELERLTRDYALGIGSLIGSEGGLPAPEICGNEAAGRGVFYAVRDACEHLCIPVKNARVAVQGFGKVGSVAASHLSAAGAIIAAASDTRGAIYDARGLDMAKLIAHKERSGSVVGFPGSDPICDCELLALECEILVPAARENAIHGQNSPAIRARVVAEAADGPVTPAADQILEGQGVFVIPDILCNAGGVTAVYYECVRKQQNLACEEQDVYARLERDMRVSFQEVLAISRGRGVNMRHAANMLGVSRVAEATKLRRRQMAATSPAVSQ